jgi:preprotein translocase subunit SecG
MKLSSEQIERLYAFTRQHYVEYYDLQTELVDHLANAIEEQWQQNPKLSFEEALQIEFKKFGVFGFMEVVEKRQAALNKKYNKLVWQLLKTFFSIPKIIGTISAIGIVYYLLKSSQEGIEIIQAIFIILIVLFMIGLGVISRKNKKKNQQTEKKWLLKEIIFGYSTIAGSINIPIQLVLHLNGEHYNDWTLALFSFLLVLLSLTIYIVLVLIPSQAEDYLKATYPEYELLQKL